MKVKFCQSCGMQMTAAEQFGSNADGTPNEEYCSYLIKIWSVRTRRRKRDPK